MLWLSVLGSGSSGNSALVRLGARGAVRHLLIDAGLSPRQTGRRLARLGIALDTIDEILLTHLDIDHLHPGWNGRLRRRHAATVHVHERHRHRAARCGLPVARISPFADRIDLGPRTSVDGLLLAHDQLGTVGYVLEHAGRRLGFATDLGRVPRSLLRGFVDLHGLAIESNYDRGLQLRSDRPDFLKRRIMGGTGHLSNDQALEAVLRIAESSELSQIALLHLSRQCNHPVLVRRLYDEAAPHLLPRITIARPDRPTPLLPLSRVGRGRRRAAQRTPALTKCPW